MMYAEAMSTVRREINLTEQDIARLRPRKTVTRALILKLHDREGSQEKV
jgi:hypothetical protein